jgi:ADP-heptose:LPS heptosyltransferase/GT2 family glycosyltransferase
VFSEYDLVARSGLFDADYYLAANPDVAAVNIDPLMHYLESGASELRNPNPGFDAQHYVALCRKLGQTVDNPLLHYLKVGAAQGLSTRPEPKNAASLRRAAPGVPPRAAIQQPPMKLHIDTAEVDSTQKLRVAGWALAAEPIVLVQCFVGDQELAPAEYGMVRQDVAATHAEYPNATHSGFALQADIGRFDGAHSIRVRARAASGLVSESSLSITRGSDARVDAGAPTIMLSIDLPKISNGEVATPVRENLEIAGWALARAGAVNLDVAIDGRHIKSIQTGVRRVDVERAFPDWKNAITAGFSSFLPHRSLPVGPHTISIEARSESGQRTRAEFRIQVEEIPDLNGPWALRRRMPPGEIKLAQEALRGREPDFHVLLPLPADAASRAAARITLASLCQQVYERWQLHILAAGRKAETARRELLAGFEGLADRVRILSGTAPWNARGYVLRLRCGDELGCDALLELAVQGVLHPEADFLYADERRRNPASNKVAAFFKPQWSPELQLSTNYLGRAWCARADVLQRSAIRIGDWGALGDYDLSLRLSEQAHAIRHVPAVLLQTGGAPDEDEVNERAALRDALARRGIDAVAAPGRTPGTYRIKRQVAGSGLVSIIIPTCAARGLIRRCIESLRSLTAYQPFEIVCIENIPAADKETKRWLRSHADRVVETTEPFNWSRFNNLAAAAANGEFLLFLNDDIEVTDPKWLEVLLEQAQRPEIGAVGPQLLYPDRRVQHAGMFLAGEGLARHAFRNGGEDDPGYFGLALTLREVIAVTGACLLTRRETFEAVGRFDENHDLVNNDVDFCLRVWQGGHKILYTPHTQLIHHELASRAHLPDHYDSTAFDQRWRSLFAEGDPYFHPRLSRERDDYALEWEALGVHVAGAPLFELEGIRRILVVKLDHIGDCVTALPAVRRLKRHFPQATLTVLSGPGSKAIWSLEPAVGECIEFSFFHTRSGSGLVDRDANDWQRLRQQLQPRGFDLAIDLRKHGESRTVLQHTGARYLAGFDSKGKFPWLDIAIEWAEDIALNPKRQHVADDLINLIDAVAAAGDADRNTLAQPPPATLSQKTNISAATMRKIFHKRVICVHPGVGNELRQWPESHFSQLIDRLVESEGVHVILIGSPDEAELGQRIWQRVTDRKSVWPLVGRVALEDLPALIAKCALFVGNNSGPQHIAAALGVPTVGIHSGVVDAREWGPKGPRGVAVQRAMTCAPCYHSRLSECNREFACMRGLAPMDVLPVCRRMLALSAARL